MPVAGEPGLCAVVPTGKSKYPVDELLWSDTAAGGKLVQFVSVPLDGVPKAGVTNVGLVANTKEPVPVSSVTADKDKLQIHSLCLH